MVHKKSEYRLQFPFLAKDLRKQIWQDNIRFRETCRSLNHEDHYWSYQLTDERCECENDEEEDEAVLPPHKLKHKILLAQYENTESQKDTQRVLKQDIFSPTEVQERAKQQVQKDARDARDMAVQTPDWESQEKRLKDEPSNKTGHIVQNLNKKYSESIKGQKLKDQQTAVVPVTAKHQNASLQKSNTQTTVKKMEHRCGTSCGHHAEARVQPSSSRTSALTRTNRKAYFEGKKTPFASFGWNDSERNIGQKKTYNVSAPENEVYPPALLALKQRREDIEKYLAKAAQKRREEKSSFSASVVNHSSIWMTEYQDKFSHRRNFVPEYISKRPTSAPPCRKYAGWRYS